MVLIIGTTKMGPLICGNSHLCICSYYEESGETPFRKHINRRLASVRRVLRVVLPASWVSSTPTNKENNRTSVCTYICIPEGPTDLLFVSLGFGASLVGSGALQPQLRGVYGGWGLGAGLPAAATGSWTGTSRTCRTFPQRAPFRAHLTFRQLPHAQALASAVQDR